MSESFTAFHGLLFVLLIGLASSLVKIRGDVVLLHHRPGKRDDQAAAATTGSYHASGFLMSPPGGNGHKDVIRCLYHDVRVRLPFCALHGLVAKTK